MPQRTNFREMACSIARTWSVIGEPWTPLILRDVAVGIRRFDALRRDLGMASNTLTERLKVLESEGVIERRPYSDGGRRRDEYHLTERGRQLVPLLVAIANWGDAWLADTGPPAVFRHESCGSTGVTVHVVCSDCGELVTADNTTVLPGPGAASGPGTYQIGDVVTRPTSG